MENEIPQIQIEGPWVTLEAIIKNSQGIHARPSALIVRKTITYKGEILLEKLGPFEKDEERKNSTDCKSLTGIMMQNLPQDSKIKLYVEIYDDKSPKEKQIETAKTFCRELYQLVTSEFEAAYN
jgi:phosphotransferase system HPr (HPr) family protein